MRFLIPLVFACGVLQANEPVRMEVKDESGRAVPQALAYFYNAARVLAASGVTDDEGVLLVELPARGAYLLTVRHAGFEDRNAAVDAPGSVKLTLSVRAAQDDITVTAESGRVQSTGMVAQRITLLSQETLRERIVTALTEAGTGEAGVEQLRTSSTMGAFFVRGLTGKNVAVYRDGVRFTTSAQRGGVSTFQNLLESSNLSAVEFVRGPNGAQYGSDAVGGAVNVQSKAPGISSTSPRWNGEIAPFFHSATNGFGGNAAIAYSGIRAGFVSNLSARRINTFRTGGGFDSHAAVTRFLGLPSNVIGGERLPDTAFTQYGGSMHAQFLLSSKQRLVGHYERGQQDGGKRYDQLLGGDGNLIADLRNLMMDFGYLRLQRFGWGVFDQASLTGSFNAQREERVNQGGQGNPAASITNQFERNRVVGLQFQLAKRLGGGHEGLIGGEGYHEKMVSPAFTFNPATGVTVASRPRVPDGATYKTHGLFAQDAWSPFASGRLRLGGALRFGGATYRSPATALNLSDSLTANALSGRFGGVLRVVERLSLHATYSRGFRAPNMTDLGTLGIQGNGFFEANVNDVTARGARIGNRADDLAVDSGLAVERLRPEKTGNYDVGAQFRGGRVMFEGTAFWIRLNNAIVSQTLLLPQGAVGQALGDQIISRQLPSGAVFVPIATQPVLVRANFTGARLNGFEQRFKLRITRQLAFDQNLTYIYAKDAVTGLAPDIEPGSPPTMANFRLLWSPPSKRFWMEMYSTVADRQTRIPSISLSDRRTGANRSRTNIANFFNNGARARGLVSNGILIATGETVAQVQNRVLGTAASAPMFTAIPGWGIVGVRAGVPVGERSDVFVDFSNIADRNYRGIGWGMDGAGRSVTLKWRMRF
jgi:outer membrane receptor protein involved in Fe transport